MEYWNPWLDCKWYSFYNDSGQTRQFAFCGIKPKKSKKDKKQYKAMTTRQRHGCWR